ncbi:hypothetical protein MMC26_000358 [Xylographa opegraphella]|nr:hypothetical protein [Xylographa opegraphella]
MPPKPKMPHLTPATPPVTPAKKSAKPARMTRAMATVADLSPVAETDSAVEIDAANEGSDAASTSDATNEEDGTEACVKVKEGKQVAEVKNAAANKNVSAARKPAATGPAAKQQPAKKQPTAQGSAAKNTPANKRAAALKASEVSAQVESTEDEGPPEEFEAVKQTAPKKMPPPRGGRAGGKSTDAMDIDSSEQAEHSQQRQAQKPKQTRQPQASNRQGFQTKPSGPRGGGNDQSKSSYLDDSPSLEPLYKTRFKGHGKVLPVVEYDKAGERIPCYLDELSQLRTKLLQQIPYVFHQEREHRLANEALELTREYVSALMYQEINMDLLIEQHIGDDKMHKKHGVKLTAAEKQTRSDLLEDLKNTGRLDKFVKVNMMIKEMERKLGYMATEDEEKARWQKLKNETETKKAKKAQKGKGRTAETAETDEENIEGDEAEEGVEEEEEDEEEEVEEEGGDAGADDEDDE